MGYIKGFILEIVFGLIAIIILIYQSFINGKNSLKAKLQENRNDKLRNIKKIDSYVDNLSDDQLANILRKSKRK